jgi:hypothetical protein
VTRRNMAPEFSAFSAEFARTVADSLPKSVCSRRLKLLPEILQEWSRTDLQRHLSMGSPAIRRAARIKKLETVKKCARRLLEAMQAVDEKGRTDILVQMIIAEGRRREDASRAEVTNRITRLEEERDFLAKLSAIAPRESWKPRRGQPRNIRAYLVLQDAAAIFEWLTGKKAYRAVNHNNGTEAGPFFRFASTLWPVIFGKGVAGLPAAMKNWASARSLYDEQSALLGNMAGRHPSWGVFER